MVELLVIWILIAFVGGLFMRGLDLFFAATRMKNIKHKKEMLAWMAGATGLFYLGGDRVWEDLWREAVLWFGLGGWVLWLGIKKQKERNEQEASWKQSVSDQDNVQDIQRHPENYRDDFKKWLNENHPNLLLGAKTDNPEPSNSKLKTASKQIINWAAIIFVATCLFPPWQYTADRNGSEGFHSRKPAGYSSIFSPPTPKYEGVNYGVQIDSSRLGIEWAAIAVVAGAVWAFVVKPAWSRDDKARPPQRIILPPGNPEN
jgi:hypothetical protein